ncbi:MAG: recombinase family protein, partial [Lachnospiraceae bacterium]|nr:recombinase family protein [Lachnospiraceae bacterium]
EQLQSKLLTGDTFGYIDHIEENGLNDLFNVLASGKIADAIYSSSVKLKEKAPVDPEIARLRSEKQKTERALDRLRNLYLYSEDAMSEAEYIIQKKQLTDTLDEINEQIGIINSGEWQQSVSDEVFIQRASEFILAQKLTGRKYVNYKRLSQSVDAEVLRSFVLSIIDSITMYDGKVSQIIFKNGLSHSFIFRE